MQPIDIILIIGLGHSGSTILERALASHPDCVGLGEVDRTIDEYSNSGSTAFKRPCTCGEVVDACPVWSGIFASSKGSAINSQLMELIQHTIKTTGCRVVIDSSKRITQADNYKQLMETGQIRLIPIFLVRDYRGWCTTRKFRKRMGEQGSLSYTRRAWKWLIGNLRMVKNMHELDTNYTVVLYDDFAKNPYSTLSEIWKHAGLPPFALMTGSELPPVNQHSLRGNGMRYDSKRNRSITYDDSWKNDWRTRWLKFFVFGPEVYRWYLIWSLKKQDI